MRKELWNQILAFDLDKPMSEYGFSIRLAHENNWPASFTEQAILEYKKFMYLAATSGTMVSPSEIVDTVWHQHLIFTHSYDEFCQILGKKVAHIPSTHNKAQAAQFEEAKKQTTQAYRQAFGEQPYTFWNCNTPYESIELKRSRFHVKNLLTWGIVAFLLLLKPAYLLLKDIYAGMSSDFFLSAYIILSTSVLLILEMANRSVLKSFLQRLGKESFLFRLSPTELIYMRSEDVEDLIHTTVNRLVRENKVNILKDRRLENASDYDCSNAQEQAVKDYIGTSQRVYYNLLVSLSAKPAFQNTRQFGVALKRYFIKTRLFINLFLVNLITIGCTLLIGFSRLATGIVRGKPIAFLVFTLAVIVCFVISHLTRSISTLSRVLIPKFYSSTIDTLPYAEKTLEWKVFLHGKDAYYAALLPVIAYANYEKSGISGWIASFESNSNGSCGSGCGGGSSCGGGCGGCGGCGG